MVYDPEPIQDFGLRVGGEWEEDTGRRVDHSWQKTRARAGGVRGGDHARSLGGGMIKESFRDSGEEARTGISLVGFFTTR